MLAQNLPCFESKSAPMELKNQSIDSHAGVLPTSQFHVLHCCLMILMFSLSENSDENMMDSYNIAVCFGPTLLPVPDGYDQVSTQANVNEIIKVRNFYIPDQ